MESSFDPSFLTRSISASSSGFVVNNNCVSRGTVSLQMPRPNGVIMKISEYSVVFVTEDRSRYSISDNTMRPLFRNAAMLSVFCLSSPTNSAFSSK